MRLGFDLRPFLREETGVGTYLRNLLFELARLDRANEYFLFSASWKDRFAAAKVPSFARGRFRDRRVPVKLLNFFWQRWGVPPLDWFVGARLDLTHSATPLLLPTKGRKIITVHDLFFMDRPSFVGREAGRVFFRRAADAFRRSDGIVTFSAFTRDELVTRFDVLAGKVRVIPHGLDRRFLEDVSAAEREEFRTAHHLPPSFLLFVGAQEPRKNLPRLLEALKIVHLHGHSLALVLAGPPGADTPVIRETARRLGLDRWLTMTGYLSPAELRKIYRLAAVFVFPSLCEGFGLPLVEAMASGLPVVAAMNSAMPEVCGDAALFCRAEDPESIAEKIQVVLESGPVRQELAAKGRRRALAFRWDKAAAETLEFYRSFGPP
jgi:glycosyltransferase involved in cell wall biosynthesis